MRTFFPFQNSHGQTSPQTNVAAAHHSSHFNMEKPEESVISETSKHLNGLNSVYDRNSVQRINMATPAYEQVLPRLTTDYPARVAEYDEKHSNSPHRDMPYETQYRHSKPPLKATQLGLDDTVSQSLYMVMCTQSHQARKRYTIGAALFSWLILAGYLVLPNTFTSSRENFEGDRDARGCPSLSDISSRLPGSISS